MRKAGLIFITLCVLFLILWISFPFVIHFLQPNWTVSGSIGDSFGILNTLFLTLAFAGIIVSIFMQRDELTLQREEMKLQREEMKLQREEMKLSRQDIVFNKIINVIYTQCDQLNIVIHKITSEIDMDIRSRSIISHFSNPEIKSKKNLVELTGIAAIEGISIKYSKTLVKIKTPTEKHERILTVSESLRELDEDYKQISSLIAILYSTVLLSQTLIFRSELNFENKKILFSILHCNLPLELYNLTLSLNKIRLEIERYNLEHLIRAEYRLMLTQVEQILPSFDIEFKRENFTKFHQL